MIGTQYFLNSKIDYQEFINLPYSEQDYFKRITEEEGIMDQYANDLDIQD